MAILSSIIQRVAGSLTHSAPSLTGRAAVGAFAFLLFLLASCTSPSLPTTYTQGKAHPKIYPDYINVTVPVNIAPLHFHIDQDADTYITRFSTADDEWLVSGRDVRPGIKTWRTITATAVAAKAPISVEVYIQHDGQWLRTLPFDIAVSPDSIDPYISYRLISPSYVTYEDLTLNQRCLETFDETLIYGNMINTDEANGQCINCHHTQWYNPQRLQFHVRQYLGGTVISYDGKTEKLNLKTDSTFGAGVYPTWHPRQPWIVYSINHTGQSFHTRDPQKIEVQDTKSNLIFYDVEHNEVTPITRDTTWLDCFPFWSPDGRYVYYVSAHWERLDTVALDFELIQNYKAVQYNLYRMPFDEQTRTFGPRQLIYDAVARNRSVTLPRISPDGRWLMFTEARFGIFHIWHTDADLYLLDLNRAKPIPEVEHTIVTEIPNPNDPHEPIMWKRERADSIREVIGSMFPLPEIIQPATALNSEDCESYHSWSSNSHWVIFSSRRTDGNFTRPYIAHHDGNGNFTRPFELPQDNPQYHRLFLRSYNIPEFMAGPVTITPQEFATVIKRDATPAKLKLNPRQ